MPRLNLSDDEAAAIQRWRHATAEARAFNEAIELAKTSVDITVSRFLPVAEVTFDHKTKQDFVTVSIPDMILAVKEQLDAAKREVKLP